MNLIWAPKQSCPRNKGYFYCEDCYRQALSETVDTGYPCDINQHPFRGCGKNVEGKYCGYTHMGYSWCEDCLKIGRLECTHYGFEVMGKIKERDDLEFLDSLSKTIRSQCVQVCCIKLKYKLLRKDLNV